MLETERFRRNYWPEHFFAHEARRAVESLSRRHENIAFYTNVPETFFYHWLYIPCHIKGDLTEARGAKLGAGEQGDPQTRECNVEAVRKRAPVGADAASRVAHRLC
jgi:hypothetical protein